MLSCSPTPTKHSSRKPALTDACWSTKSFSPLLCACWLCAPPAPTGDTLRVLGNGGKGKTPSLFPIH